MKIFICLAFNCYSYVNDPSFNVLREVYWIASWAWFDEGGERGVGLKEVFVHGGEMLPVNFCGGEFWWAEVVQVVDHSV